MPADLLAMGHLDLCDDFQLQNLALIDKSIWRS